MIFSFIILHKPFKNIHFEIYDSYNQYSYYCKHQLYITVRSIMDYCP